MLSSLELENFKGIADRQRIDFAPLTLLFGANSAGKSTILQALLYLHEVLERGSADVDRTELGGNVLELGGFARLVHRHDADRSIMLRAEFATPGSLERFGRDLTRFPFPDLDDEVESAWVELTIQYRDSPGFRGPMVERATIGVNDVSVPLVWLETPGAMREGESLYCRINLGHPLVVEHGREIADDWLIVGVPEPLWHRGIDPSYPERGPVLGLDDLIDPGEGGPFPLVAVARTRPSALPPLDVPIRVISDESEPAQEMQDSLDQIRTFLEMVVLGTTAQLASFLRGALYIGPLRAIPPRGFLYERAGRITSWADGLAAWELLLADRTNLVERTNAWLKRLGADCQIVVQQLFDRTADAEELTVHSVDKTVRRLLLDTGAGSLVLPSEVGAGISQLIPVIVAALSERSGLSLVEQPEIHVHPRVQVGIGDLFIEAATKERGRRILLAETHSEHLILRLLRRIRETADNELAEGAPEFVAERLSVLHVESSPNGVRVRRLRVDRHGEFTDRWPKGFFEERAEELF